MTDNKKDEIVEEVVETEEGVQQEETIDDVEEKDGKKKKFFKKPKYDVTKDPLYIELKEENEKLLDQLLRKQAEFENYKKRVMEERQRDRKYALQEGKLVTLEEKNRKNNYVDKLIGSAILHKGIKTHVVPESRFYDHENLEKNDVLVPFDVRAKEIEYFHNKGIKKL